MKICSITSTSFNGSIKISAAENKKNPYLYNHVLNITKEYGIPANFRTHEIELPSASISIYKELNKLKIKFHSVKKHQ